MNRDRLFTALTAAVLAFFTAWGCIDCLISAFDLHLQNPSAPVMIFVFASITAALLLSCRYGSTILLCVLALFSGYICHDGTALEQLKSLITQLSTIYDRAYGWGILNFSEKSAQSCFADWPLCIWGTLISIAVCRTVCQQKSVWLPVLVTVLPLCSCIVVTDTVPDEAFLLMVLAGLILLILTSFVRRENPCQANRLTATAAIPVLLALTGLFFAVPQKSYVNYSELFRENILTAARNLPQLLENGMGELASGLQIQPPKQVNLAALGDRIPFTYPVMEVTAENTGTLYLREQDYDQYDGLGWKSAENRVESFQSAAGRTESIYIHTRAGKQTRFLPYHPTLNTVLVNGAAENPEQEQAYTVLRSALPENWRQTAYENTVGSPTEWQAYCALPETTRQDATTFLEPLYDDGISNTAKADIIAAFVTDSARYDTRPPKMPVGETDFALWFLRDGDAGYCVHFATAATVLLRAAGIPARYVTGYMLEAEAGTPVLVTEENAHAWAEYYEPNLGVWLPLEATPASEPPVQTHPQTVTTETTIPAETESDESKAVTEPSQLTEPATIDTLPTPPAQPETVPSSGAKNLLILPAAVLFLILQRPVRLAIRRKHRTMGTANQQALYRWQESVRLSRLLKDSPTEELIILAQKAKFSQYELTQEELQQFDSFRRTCLRRLKERPWYLQLVYKFIHAAY